VLDLLVAFLEAVASSQELAVVGLSDGGLLGQGLAHLTGRSMDGLLAVVPGMGEREKRILPRPRLTRRESVDFGG
jgi:pimeloyl-ACP methyl ester carboxylesterase